MYFYFRAGGNDRQMIQDAMSEFHKNTCIKFKERRPYDTDYVFFTNGNTGCWSSVGRIGGRQEVSFNNISRLATPDFSPLVTRCIIF